MNMPVFPRPNDSSHQSPSGGDAPWVRSLDTEWLLSLWCKLNARQCELGYARYDYGDLHSHPLFRWLNSKRGGCIFQKLLWVPDVIAPLWWRRLLRVRKQVVPSLFYHLGMTYIARSQLVSQPCSCASLLESVCQDAIRLRLKAMHACWGHPYTHHGGNWHGALPSDVPPSCAHHTGRVGLMLLMAGQSLGRTDWKEVGISAARALLEYHNWKFYSDGSCTVSYYPNTCDEVINTGADAAMLMAAVPAQDRTSAMQAAMEGLVRMLVSEQHADGGWDYCTRRHYERLKGRRNIDNHHTAMNLNALRYIVQSGALPAAASQAARTALDKGLGFYLKELLLPNGVGLYMAGHRRHTGVVGYSEGVSAMTLYLRGLRPDENDLVASMRRMVPKMLAVAIQQFVDHRSGDVACCQLLGRPYHIQSARWGSAPLMQAITDYLWMQEVNE